MRGPALLLLAAGADFCRGQALFTGETSGKGVSSVFVAANASRVRDFTTPLNIWTAYTLGVHDRVDAFVLYGNLTIFGQTQHYGGLGANLGILKRARHGVYVAFLGLISTPFNYREEASTVYTMFAPIASRPVRLGGRTITLYGGYLRTEPFGRRADKLFSPPAATHNGMVGAVTPLSKSLSLITEYDPGAAQQNFGVAVLYVFPSK